MENLDDVDGVPNIIVEPNRSVCSEKSWILCDQRFPRSEIVFGVQTTLVFLLVIVSVTCLAFAETCEQTTVWIAILSSSVGYMLPAPKL